MTTAPLSLLDRPVTPGDELHACLDAVLDVDLDALGVSGQTAMLRALARAEARINAARMRLLAAAERSRAAARTGAADTGQWAAQVTRSDQVVARREVGLARGLERRAATQEALAAGSISTDHAAVIVRADQQLPAGLSDADRRMVEASLLRKAVVLSPASLRRAARRALDAVEADIRVVDEHENSLVAAEEEHARTRTRLTLHDNGDGTVTGRFVVPTLHGELLRKLLETMTAPRRARPGATEAQAGLPEARTDWDRARGEAFCEVLEHLPTDHLHPRTAATVVVTLAHEALRDAVRVAGLDTGGEITAGEARRLACNAGVIPAVLGGGSLPLDLGRRSRLFTEAQRTALGLRHRDCAADGCERPFAWCELHHENPWSRGGRTDLARAIPLCHFHHQRIHDPAFHHTRAPDGSIRFRLRR